MRRLLPLALLLALVAAPALAQIGATPIDGSGSGGGVSNGAANGVIPKSDGTNLVGSVLSEKSGGLVIPRNIQLPDGYGWINISNDGPSMGYSGATIGAAGAGLGVAFVSGNGGYFGISSASGTGGSSDPLYADTLWGRHGAAGAVGWGLASATPQAYTHTLAADASSADTSGGNATLTPGIGRGNAAGSTLTIATPDPVASGSTVQTVSPRMTFGPAGATVPGGISITRNSVSDGDILVKLGGGSDFGISASNANPPYPIWFTTGGNGQVLSISRDMLAVQATTTIGWSANATTGQYPVLDTGLARASAGVVKVTDGSTGNGTIQIGANAAAGKVLTSDANGVVSWQPPSSHVSAVPVMTSDTAPSGVASASSSHATMAAWKAFIGPAGGWFNNGEAAPAWIQYQFPTARAITGYSIVPWSLDSWDAPSRQPLGWHLDGSNDGSSWTVLHTVAHTWPWQRWVKEYFGFVNATAYTHYRLVITDTGGNLYIGLQALELFQ